MTGKTKPAAAPLEPETASPFRLAVEDALRHYHDPVWLGENSPLATPFVLPRELLIEHEPHRPETRGRLLQRQLASAARSLPASPDGRFDPARLLNLTFFQAYQNLNQAGIALQLGLSPATYYRHRLEALALLEDALARSLQPAPRAEHPPTVASLVGREHVVESCLAALRRGRCVALSGGTGLGKTSLGAAIATQSTRDINASQHDWFWFTFRRGFNDNLEGFLFALANFLHTHGQPALWLQLTATRARTNEQIALSLARDGLARIDPKPLVCLDEIDLLLPSDSDTGETLRLRSFIEALVQAPRDARTDAFPVLLIGQQLLLEPDVHHILHGLTAEQTRQLVQLSRIELDPADARTLHTATRGNPLLIKLFCSLVDGSSSVAEALRQVVATPTVGLLLQRVRRKLSNDERQALDWLAVFRNSAPADLFGVDGSIVVRLAQIDVVTQDGHGGLALLPSLREAAYQQLGAEAREYGHQRAAKALAARAEFTEAAWHYVCAHQSANAIALWYPQRALEIGRGNAGHALAVFREVSREQLPVDARRMLVLIRGELHRLVGESDAILEDLDGVDWPLTESLTPAAREMQGDVLRDTDQPQAAASRYREGLAALDATSARTEAQRVRLHVRLGDTHWFSGNSNDGLVEALRARYTAEQFQGIMHQRRGDYELAQQHYSIALGLANQARDAIGQALVHFQIASLCVQREQTEDAIHHFDSARCGYQQIGDVVRVMRCQTNLAALYVQMQRFDEAVAPATEALNFFLRVGQPGWLATNLSNLAEAQLGLGQIDEAERNAVRALSIEEASNRPYALTVLANVYSARKQWSAAGQHLREAIALAQQLEDRWAEAPTHRALACCLSAQGKSDAAHIECEIALAIYAALGLAREVERTRTLCS